jgi:branched-chain amino acid aminotransferase
VSNFCYVNGLIVEATESFISVFDHGFTVADGVFETLKINSGEVFALDRHLRRLENSCRNLGIAFPSKPLIHEAVASTAIANKTTVKGRMRITVTSGLGPLGSDRITTEPTLVISVAEQKPWGECAELLLVPWTRNVDSPIVGIKTTSYAENVYALDVAHNLGFTEAIFMSSNGLLSEGTGSNVFLVKDGQIVTPGTNAALLPGITRELVLEWISTVIPTYERDLTQADLFTADEVFITSSTRDVQPVSRIAAMDYEKNIIIEKSLPVGKVSKEVMRIFDRNSSESNNP